NENPEKSLLDAFARARGKCAAVVRIAADIAAVGTLFDVGRTDDGIVGHRRRGRPGRGGLAGDRQGCAAGAQHQQQCGRKKNLDQDNSLSSSAFSRTKSSSPSFCSRMRPSLPMMKLVGVSCTLPKARACSPSTSSTTGN